MSPSLPDLTVAGAGPAGLALAAAAARRGLHVRVVDPAPDAAWPNQYGAWEQDRQALDLDVPVDARWEQVLVDTGAGPRRIPGTYTRIDAGALRNQLIHTLHDHGASLRTGRVLAAAHDATGTELTLTGGETLRTRVLVDATGTGALLDRRGGPTAWQAALGWLARVDAHPWQPGQAAFMDFSDAHLDPAAHTGPPTFLYALPLAEDLVFVEETSLAASPAVPLDLLEARLARRLAHRGIQVRAIEHTERCLIPMNTPIPSPGRIVGVGAGAGWVHPATGYQLVRALDRALPIAEALAHGLDTTPTRAAELAWDRVWPAAHRRTRALHDLGLGLLLSMDAGQTRAFFQAFFELPESSWRAYLDATSSPGAVASTMRRVLFALDSDLRGTVVRHALGRGRSELLRALSPHLGGV